MSNHDLRCIVIIILIIIIMYLFTNNIILNKEKFAWSDPNVEPGAVYSTYKNYDKKTSSKPGTWPGIKTMIVGFHYIDGCPKCDLLRPIWEKIKRDLAGMDIEFVENNESIKSTPEISEYPTIIKYQNGVGDKYQGMYEYEDIRNWILKTTHDRMYYFAIS